MRHASRSSGLLQREASRIGFPSLASRLVEARLQVEQVASSWRLCGVEVEDRCVDTMGYVGPFYPKIVVFYVLDRRCNLVFYLSL
jgi:hypothetical protein